MISEIWASFKHARALLSVWWDYLHQPKDIKAEERRETQTVLQRWTWCPKARESNKAWLCTQHKEQLTDNKHNSEGTTPAAWSVPSLRRRSTELVSRNNLILLWCLFCIRLQSLPLSCVTFLIWGSSSFLGNTLHCKHSSAFEEQRKLILLSVCIIT